MVRIVPELTTRIRLAKFIGCFSQKVEGFEYLDVLGGIDLVEEALEPFRAGSKNRRCNVVSPFGEADESDSLVDLVRVSFPGCPLLAFELIDQAAD